MVVEQKWQIFPNQLEISQKISATLNRHSILGQILLNRKIGSIQEAEDFLGAVPASGESSRLPQFEEAAAVIEAAVSEGLPILIYGDYDVDGMTSTTMLTDFLRKLGADVTFFIPHRFKDGYGLQSSIISLMKQKEIGLLVTLDCGVTSVREITQIKAETGAKVVVMDHHTIPEIQPPFDAMINPKALEESHPMFHLCTAGIVYHFVCQFNAVYEKGLKPEYYIDLAALGTIADVARLIGENRSLVRRGLRALSAQRRFGIKAILDVAKFNRSQVSTRDVGFTIAPRLNAAGRLDNATKGVDLLLSTSYDKAFKIAERLETLNNERRYMGLTMMNESVALLKSQKKWEQNPIIGLASSEWHAGVIGIIAARMAEKFHRPAVLMAIDGDIARGSARTYGEISIYRVLKGCDAFFTAFGGHKEAAGFSIRTERVKDFLDFLVAQSHTLIKKDEMVSIINIDCQLSPQDVTMALATELRELEPFGHGNPMPVFYSNRFEAVDFKTVGDGRHLKVRLADASGKNVVDAIGFGLADKLPLLYKKNVEIVYNLDINVWQGTSSPQLQIVDIK